MAEVDDAEAVALGVGQHDEVRVVGEAVPVDAAAAQRDQAVRLCLLLGRIRDVQVEMVPRVVIRRCLAEPQLASQPEIRPAGPRVSPTERNETLVPWRSNALESRFHGVRHDGYLAWAIFVTG